MRQDKQVQLYTKAAMTYMCHVVNVPPVKNVMSQSNLVIFVIDHNVSTIIVASSGIANVSLAVIRECIDYCASPIIVSWKSRTSLYSHPCLGGVGGMVAWTMTSNDLDRDKFVWTR